MELGTTYWAKSDRCSSKPYKATIASMGLVNSVRIVVAQLLQDLRDALVVLGSDQLADDSFEPENDEVSGYSSRDG